MKKTWVSKSGGTVSNIPLQSHKEAYEEGYTKGLTDRNPNIYEAVKTARKELLEEVEDFITEEILICHKENTPTSRLTSLAMKIKSLN